MADGRNYIGSAWWVAFWPGLAIMLVTMSLNLFSNWLRIATDPVERWRLGRFTLEETRELAADIRPSELRRSESGAARGG